MKRVYLVVCHAVNNYEDFGVGTTLFATREKAQEYFNKQVANEKKAIEGFGWVVGVDNDNIFEAYEDGNFTANHTWCEIRELVIE